MTTSTVRRLLLAAATAVAVGAGLAGAPPANAAPTAPALPRYWQVLSGTISGDVTGDGVRDRFEFAGLQSGAACGLLLRVGLGNGTFADPDLLRLPLAEGTASYCPDLGVVVTAPTAAQNRLAATSGFGHGVVQVLDYTDGRFTQQARFDAIDIQPNIIGTRDFDGDGWGDLWVLSGNDGVTFEAFVSHADRWAVLYKTPDNMPVAPQFLDLDHDGGTDVLLNRDFFVGAPYYGSYVDVLNGRTGQVLALARTRSAQGLHVEGRFLDYDLDNRMDIEVTTTDSNKRRVGYQVYLNRTRTGAWSFVPRFPATAAGPTG